MDSPRTIKVENLQIRPCTKNGEFGEERRKKRYGESERRGRPCEKRDWRAEDIMCFWWVFTKRVCGGVLHIRFLCKKFLESLFLS